MDSVVRGAWYGSSLREQRTSACRALATTSRLWITPLGQKQRSGDHVHRLLVVVRFEQAAVEVHRHLQAAMAFEGLHRLRLPVCPICTLQRAGVCRGSRDPFAWHRRRYRSTHPGQLGYAHVETSQQELRQPRQEQRLPGKRASTPRSRHENGHLAQRGLIRLWRRSSKHVQEPWLTTITGSGADSSNSRMVAAMASLERRRLMS